MDAVFLWEWEYDQDFVSILERQCRQFGIETYLVHPYNLADVEKKALYGEFTARFLYDRASDTNAAF
ncbi:MAG TPA: hypothetical protein VLR94_11060, partial [Acidobacteriota bacterium]|nr:hypothetical protein [Acidobacteriota bacterium]